MELSFGMPQDGDWDSGLWERIGVGPEWDRLAADFESAGAEVDDTEDITLSFRRKDEKKVRQVIADARGGGYGDDVRAYWGAAEEVRG